MYIGERIRLNGLNLIVKKGNCFDCKLNHLSVDCKNLLSTDGFHYPCGELMEKGHHFQLDESRKLDNKEALKEMGETKTKINGHDVVIKKGACVECVFYRKFINCKKCWLKRGECFEFEEVAPKTGQGHEVVKKDPENGEYYRNGFEAVDIMNLITIPEGLNNGQKHSLLNVIKRISRFGKKDDPKKEAKKISEELNHIVNGKYR